MRGTLIVLEFDGEAVSIARISTRAGSARVLSLVSGTKPREVDPSDARAVGEWLGGLAREAGAGRGASLVVAASRREIALRRLSVDLPAGAGEDAKAFTKDELPGLVRVNLLKQLTMPIEQSVVDFVVVRSEEGVPREALAAVASAARIEHWNDIARAAGLRLRGVVPRGVGVARLARGEGDESSCLLVAPGARSTEIVVVESGRLSATREAEVGLDEDALAQDAAADRIAVEVKRTWMGHRVSASGAPVSGEAGLGASAVRVLGRGALGSRLAHACRALIEIPAEVMDGEGVVSFEAEPPQHAAGVALALAGVALAHREGTIDLANPTRAPDPAQKVRTRALAAALVGLMLFGVLYVVSGLRVAALDGQLARLKEQQGELEKQVVRMSAEELRVGHAEAWLGARADWLERLSAIQGSLPERGRIVLSQLGAASDAEVGFTKSSSVGGAFASSGRVRVSITGAAEQREEIVALRERLIQEGGYAVEPRGPDNDRDVAIDLIAPLKPARGGGGK
ncbi:MAG: hypothetical protein RBS39_11225 [Phycisphaerales bacterium]|jgi:hypothetical protein|nr:hypothetical protein [Phycisphaerales bacterium]